MKLFEMAKKFGDGFKEGWNGCQSDGKTEWQDDENADASLFEEEIMDFETPAYDDVYAANHQTYYPEHRIYK